MRSLDDIDLEILQLLSDDARRPYSDIANHVGLTPPAVSDRVDRLEEQGVIRGFTVDVDQSRLEQSLPVLIKLQPKPDAVSNVYESVAALKEVEHVFEGLDGSLVVSATLPETDVRSWLESGLDLTRLVGYDVTVLNRSSRSLGVSATGFALECVVCGKEIAGNGVTAKVDGEVKQFCCSSCESRYVERYETHQNALE
ncbi:AsnC family transcriptional regulator [Halostagnicola bangensis]